MQGHPAHHIHTDEGAEITVFVNNLLSQRQFLQLLRLLFTGQRSLIQCLCLSQLPAHKCQSCSPKVLQGLAPQD